MSVNYQISEDDLWRIIETATKAGVFAGERRAMGHEDWHELFEHSIRQTLDFAKTLLLQRAYAPKGWEL